MKCPNCGNEEFIESEQPFWVWGDAQLKMNDKSCYACTECGYVVFIDRHAPERFKKIKDKINVLLEEIKSLELQIVEQKKNVNNLDYHKNNLKKFEKQLKQLQELGQDNKSTRSLIECIAEEKAIIKKGFNPEAESYARSLTETLRSKQEEISNLRKAFENKLES